jgi:hypothetical protein
MSDRSSDEENDEETEEMPDPPPPKKKLKGNPNPVMPKRKKGRRKNFTAARSNHNNKNVKHIPRSKLQNNDALRERVALALQVQEGAPNAIAHGAPAMLPQSPAGAPQERNNTTNFEQVDTDKDALPADVDNGAITADYLEALSRRSPPDKEDILWTDLDTKGRHFLSPEQKHARRMGIFYYFSQVYQYVPETSGLWEGCGCIPARIWDALMLPKNTNFCQIRAVMKTILLYKEKGVQYDGLAEPRKEWSNYLIPTDSYHMEN